MKQTAFKEAIAAFGGKKVAVIGDLMLDHYSFGDVHRISPEAPIPVVKKTHEKFVLGGAANVAANIASLGAKAILCGVIGVDPAGELFLKLAQERGIDARGIVRDRARPTSVKHRVVSGGHQLVRIDTEETSRLAPLAEQALIAAFAPAITETDIVILSDYAKGVFSEKVAGEVFALAKSEGKKVLADFKPQHKALFIGADLVSLNLKEARGVTNLDGAEEIGAALAEYYNASIFLKRGGDGISIFRREFPPVHVPGRKVSVFDVSGAGDTVIAATALALASRLDLESAAHLANAAGSIVVQKSGTATLTLEELLSALQFDAHVADVGVVPKVWGYEKWLTNNDKYCCKLLSLNKGYQCSLHYHKNKDETFVVTKGHVRLEKDGEVLHLREGAFVRLEPGTVHRFTGLEDSIIMEVSTHHDEGDSYRLEESKRIA